VLPAEAGANCHGFLILANVLPWQTFDLLVANYYDGAFWGQKSFLEE
jgi:hypothetical protein